MCTPRQDFFCAIDDDQTVADVVEALVGAAFLSGGRDEALWMMNIARIQMPGIKTWADFSRVLSPTTWKPTQHTVDAATIKAVEKIIGYTFRPQAVLATALVSRYNVAVVLYSWIVRLIARWFTT